MKNVLSLIVLRVGAGAEIDVGAADGADDGTRAGVGIDDDDDEKDIDDADNKDEEG